MSLDQIESEFLQAHEAGLDVARLHSGDLSIFSAVAEQVRRLQHHDIPYVLVPGLPAFAAAAAALGRELTIPEVAQTVVLTRMAGRASRMPEGEKLASFAATGATLAIHLAIQSIGTIVAELIPHYGADCPVAVARASWPDECIVIGTLGDIQQKLVAEPIERAAIILVGHALAPAEFRDSVLYDANYQRRFLRRHSMSRRKRRMADQLAVPVEHIFHHPGCRHAVLVLCRREREGHLFATRQRHLDRLGKFAGEQGRVSGGRAAACGPSAAERALVHAHRYSALAGWRHVGIAGR